MPTISYFYGIRILMYYEDHAPPHFHARYEGDDAMISIRDGTILAGSIRGRALALIREWTSLHGEELLDNWQRAIQREPLDKIAPLP